MTEDGHLALGLRSVQLADQVWLLTDARTPFLLCPTINSDTFTLIGDCFMLDFMQGEMLDGQWGVERQDRSDKYHLIFFLFGAKIIITARTPFYDFSITTTKLTAGHPIQ